MDFLCNGRSYVVFFTVHFNHLYVVLYSSQYLCVFFRGWGCIYAKVTSVLIRSLFFMTTEDWNVYSWHRNQASRANNCIFLYAEWMLCVMLMWLCVTIWSIRTWEWTEIAFRKANDWRRNMRERNRDTKKPTHFMLIQNFHIPLYVNGRAKN